jgi:ribosomal protein S18 acetylase RimI-like enzyme
MASNIENAAIEGHVWCVEDSADRVIATVSIDQTTFPGLWTRSEESEPSWYVHRLIVSRDASGSGLGAELLDWAGTRAVRHNAKWIRIDVWTTNTELQDYYVRLGFELVRIVERDDYPSGALLQRRSSVKSTPRLIED